MKKKSGKLLLQVASLALAFFMSSTGYATGSLCVKPGGGGGCKATIQEAIDAAGPWSTINLRSGRYFENVTIPSTKTGLKIAGPRSAILYPGDDGVNASPNTGVGITVEANRVRLQGFSIHNGDDYQIELGDEVVRTQITGIASRHADDYFVYGGFGNDKTKIKNNVIDSAQSCIYIDGDNVFVEGNMGHANEELVEIDGNNAKVRWNTILASENSHSIEINGDYANVIGNTLRACDGCIDVEGDRALVQGNKLFGFYDAIDVDGDHPTVRDNKMTGGAGGDAVEVDCAECEDAWIKYNTVIDQGDDSDCFNIDAETEGMEILNNVCLRNTEVGFDLDIEGATVRNNRVEDAGGSDSGVPCFDMDGSDNLFTGNSALRCREFGFEIDGDRNRFINNKAIMNGEDGFHIDNASDATYLEKNVATNNALMGFHVEDGISPATNTVLKWNSASGNQNDLCDDGAGTTLVGNTFPNVLAVTQDGTRDCPTF